MFSKGHTKLRQLKYKFILSMKTIGFCGSTAVVWLKSYVKIWSVCLQLLHSLHATAILLFELAVNFTFISFKLSKLLRYFYFLGEAKSI